MNADIDRVCTYLCNDLGFYAYPDNGLGPTLVNVNVPDIGGLGTVVLACDFNTDGWEAAFNPPDGGDQEPLYAWLSADANAWQVALWAAGLALDPRNCLDAARSSS